MAGLITLTAQSVRYWNSCHHSAEALQAQSLRDFRAAVRHAWRCSAFYRELYRAAGLEYGDLAAVRPEQLPVIDKNDVRAQFARIAAVPLRADAAGELRPLPGTAVEVHTSGSTGKPCRFLYAPRTLTVMEANFVRLSNIGGSHFVGFGDLPIRSLHVASVGRGYASTLLLTSGLKKYHAQSLVVDTAAPLETWRARIGDFQPNFISGYASCVALVAALQEKGELSLHPKKIITGGEPLTRAEMQRMAALFDADVINYYGCTESLLIGAGASWCEGLYLFDDLNYTEVDADGRLLLTPLRNPAFPLVRYRMDDVLEGFARGSDAAPLPFTHIDRILGRAEELLWFRNAAGRRDFLHPLFLDDLDAPGLAQYQFEQRSDTSFVLRCVAPGVDAAALEAQLRAQLTEMLRRKQLENIQYTVEFVDRIPPDPRSGKVKLILPRSTPQN